MRTRDLFCVTVLLGSLAIGQDADDPLAVMTSVAVREALPAVSEVHHAYANAGGSYGVSEINVTTGVPRLVQEASAKWINRVVRPEWRPKDTITAMRAFPDVLKVERREPNGRVFSRVVADLLVITHEVDGTKVLIQENGDAVCFTARLPDAVQLDTLDVTSFLRERVRRFLNFPPDKLAGTIVSSTKTGDVLFGMMRTAGLPEIVGPPREGDPEPEWSDRLLWLTDGRMIFLYVGENERGKPIALRAKPEVLDRFGGKEPG